MLKCRQQIIVLLLITPHGGNNSNKYYPYKTSKSPSLYINKSNHTLPPLYSTKTII